MSKRIHVVVIGGGTGGLCLAQGLRQAGVSVAVYERSRSRTERLQGFRVHINPHGSRALHECLPSHLWEAFVATTGTSGNNFGMITEQLGELMHLSENDLTRGQHDPTATHYSVSRITLHQVLSSELDEVLHYDKVFERYERNADGTITCHFADGSTAVGDVVVAADGANSRVRRQYLPHAERVDTGVINVGGKLPLTDEVRAALPARLCDGPNSVIAPGPAACSSRRTTWTA
ncbi:putative NAD(P)-binding protein [Herbihabitans rhizosphaerae]|uniref:Putative NAD(P)-binding protein n=1 Tax=Herbihabitans rhizosphaerae TaxID=1872711 RepID=A0A4Q7KEW0_9PSEU|nr:FAD-dependent monooxygenase [Herbihabitans rhizosphaerae]RZS31400.1 putative NAD(P)-binding protein [Herbihabitans rhizosphaerae]